MKPWKVFLSSPVFGFEDKTVTVYADSMNLAILQAEKFNPIYIVLAVCKIEV